MQLIRQLFRTLYRFFVPVRVPPKETPIITGNETPDNKKHPY